jgi:hypothetical protein
MNIPIQFPITKEQIKKGALFKKQIEEEILVDIKKKIFEQYIKNELDKITLKIINNSESKIKREKYLFNTIQIAIRLQMKIEEFEKTYMGKHKFFNNAKISELEIIEIKNRIYDKLKEIFPDCIIQMDPLKTYILIDWN